MSVHIPPELRNRLYILDRQRCAYCLSSEENTGIPSAVDHIIPLSKDGKTVVTNTCLACRPCNEFKRDTTQAIDPLTGGMVKLFNPRQDLWGNYFEWSPDGTHVIGRTPSGRATVVALNMNHPTVIVARHRWVKAGWHPPTE